MRPSLAALSFALGLALAQTPPIPLSGPQALPLEGGSRVYLLAPQGEIGNNSLTAWDLINVLALLREPRPTDLLLIAAKVPPGQASTAQASFRLTVLDLALPLGQDPLTGLAQFALGASYSVESLGDLRVGRDLVALAQNGAEPGQVLRFGDTSGQGLLLDRLSLKAALPLLDGLLVAGVEGSLLLGRLAGGGGFDPQSQLSYDGNGFYGQLAAEAQRAQGGLGFELGLGVRTQLPTFGVSASLRGLGRVHFPQSTRTSLSATANGETAYDLIQKFKNSAQDSPGGGYTVFLPTELEVAGFYPLFLGEGSEPLYLTARSLLSFGGPLAQGFRLALGAGYRVLPNLPLRAEVALGGPAGFGVGLGGRLDLGGGGLDFLLNQKGGLLLGAKGAEFLLRGGFSF